jgi:hypothetical protein
VPKAAIEPMRPFRSATQTMFGSVRMRRQKSCAPGAGPQLTMFNRPASPATRSTAAAPPSTWATRKTRVTSPAPRNIRAWKTFVQTTAVTPPVAM